MKCDKIMKIVVDNKIPYIEGRLEGAADVVYASPADINRDLVKDADAVLVRTRTKCNKDLFDGTRVKLVATGTIGMDHIDREWCEGNGIAVANSAGCNAPGVAQYVWSSLLRNGFDLKRDTLGIIGHGNIGTIVADWGQRLGAKILVNDPPRRQAGYEDADYVDLDYLLEHSDAVTLHVPLTREGEHKTYRLIGTKELDKMKPGSILVNASRGGVVDEDAWMKAISERGIKAIVDVWEGEPAINKKLLEMAIVATPHIAGYSRQGKSRATRMVLEAVERVLGIEADTAGLEPPYVAPSGKIDPSTITCSYDPNEYGSVLRQDPDDFENIRESYIYREEPKF